MDHSGNSIMKQRLEQLKVEFEKGQKQLVILDQRRHELRDTLLRIEGAIQIMKELLDENSETNSEISEMNNSEPIAMR
jgi:hypothetical protein